MYFIKIMKYTISYLHAFVENSCRFATNEFSKVAQEPLKKQKKLD